MVAVACDHEGTNMNDQMTIWRYLPQLICNLLLAGVVIIMAPRADAQTKIVPLASQSAIVNIPAAPDLLRVCASSINAPFSTPDEQGFEDRVVKAVGEAIRRKVVFVYTTLPAIYLVRDLLDKNLCDVVAGLDAGDDRVMTTQPYYRSGYVFISRADKKIDISNWNDPKITSLGNIAVEFGSPGEAMLKSLGKYEPELNYLFSLVGYKSPRNQYVQVPPGKLVQEVVDGNADLAVAFQPSVARFVKIAQFPLTVTIIPDDAVRSDGTRVPQQFDTSMGVRKDNAKLLEDLNIGIARARPIIMKILEEEGVITLNSKS
jgi:mxaJ protein